MAFEYFLYTTEYNNTLIDRSKTSFSPLPPNTGQIYSDYFIPTNQPLYLYKESGGDIVFNDDQTINDYLESITPPPSPEDDATVGFVTGQTNQKIDKVSNAEGYMGVFNSEGNLEKTSLTVEQLSGYTSVNILQVRQSQQINDISQNWTDFNWDVTDIQNGDIIEHDPSNIDRILIKKDGFYLISYTLNVDDEANARVRINDNIIIDGSQSSTDFSGNWGALTKTFLYSLNNGDYITLQTGSGSNLNDINANATLIVVNLNGIKGQKGDPGGVGFGMYAYAKTAADGTIQDDYGLSVTYVSTGTYDYTFTTPTPDANYGVFGQPFNTTTDTNIQISNVTTNGFRLEIGQGDNGSTSDVLVDSDHSVVIFGPPPILSGETGTTWGTIIGTLSDQTDLQNELNSKLDTISSGTNDDIVTVNGSQVKDSGISIDRLLNASPILLLRDNAGGQNINVVTPVSIVWDSMDMTDTKYYSFAPNNSIITILQDGIYEISYNINLDNQTNSRVTSGVQVKLNGSLIGPTLTASYTRNNNNDDNHNALPPYPMKLSVNDEIEIVGFRLGDDNDVLTKANGSFVRITYLGK